MRQFIERFAPDLPVLSYNELEPEIEIQSVGVINISAGAAKIPVGAVNI
jgi:flagellar biosynthesis protein FlhA